MIAAGSAKLAAVPTGGSSNGSSSSSDSAADVAEEKEPEPEPEPEEEADVGGLFDSSGDDAAW